MKNIYKWLIIPSFLVVFLTFCNTNDSKDSNQNTIQNTIKLPEGISYKLDMKYDIGRPENTEVNWSAYKTNDKTPVLGSFSEFSSDRENQEFNSIEDLVDGLKFSISSLNSLSGDPSRDLNLKNFFFKYLTDNFEINGTLGKPINDSIDVYFDVLGKNTPIQFEYSTYIIPTCPYADQIIEIKGKINLVNQFDGEAFNSIHEQCSDLHKGKTWDEVDVHIKALIINETNPLY